MLRLESACRAKTLVVLELKAIAERDPKYVDAAQRCIEWLRPKEDTAPSVPPAP